MTFVLGVLLFLVASGVGAQTMYKCSDADGKVSFSDRPCATAGTKQQLHNVPTSMVENARRIGVSERYLRRMEEECRAGNLFSCQAVNDIRTGPAPQLRDEELARRWKSNVTMVTTMQKACKEGNEWMCLRLERLKRTTPEQEEKDKHALYTRMCAAGQRGACAELDEPSRPAREVAEHRAEMRRRAMARASAECQEGDKAACARVEVLKNNP